MRAITLVLLLVVAACAPNNDPDRQQAQTTAQLAQQANMETGMPGILNFQEKKLVKMLYELRDQAGLSTFTYVVDLNGGLHLLCPSIGYGIPYAVQYSNPQRTVSRYSGGIEQLPQPEPNGLFMPDALSATWVMCAADGDMKPVYVEPQIVVSPIKLATTAAR